VYTQTYMFFVQLVATLDQKRHLIHVCVVNQVSSHGISFSE